MSSNRAALVDGDILVYRVAWACQHNEYDLYLTGEREIGVLASFSGKKALNEYIKVNGFEKEDFDIVHSVTIDSIPHALHTVKAMMQNIIDKTSATEVVVYLTGSTNFRFDVLPSYKAGRPPKPELYKVIREYLIDYWDAEVTEGIEADDALGIAQWSSIQHDKETVICTNDKDLDCIPGWHYNFITDKGYYIDEAAADYNLDIQLLTGDGVDNISGIYGIGAVRANNLLTGKSTGERWILIGNKYKEFWEDNWEEVLECNTKLLKILREPLCERS